MNVSTLFIVDEPYDLMAWLVVNRCAPLTAVWMNECCLQAPSGKAYISSSGHDRVWCTNANCGHRAVTLLTTP